MTDGVYLKITQANQFLNRSLDILFTYCLPNRELDSRRHLRALELTIGLVVIHRYRCFERIIITLQIDISQNYCQLKYSWIFLALDFRHGLDSRDNMNGKLIYSYSTSSAG